MCPVYGVWHEYHQFTTLLLGPIFMLDPHGRSFATRWSPRFFQPKPLYEFVILWFCAWPTVHEIVLSERDPHLVSSRGAPTCQWHWQAAHAFKGCQHMKLLCSYTLSAVHRKQTFLCLSAARHFLCLSNSLSSGITLLCRGRIWVYT